MTADTNAPSAQPALQRTYLKSLSVELPTAPHSFLDRTPPHLDCNIGRSHHTLGQHVYEVVLSAFVSLTLGPRVLLLVRAEQAGIFDLSGCADDERDHALNVTCPAMVLPFLRTQIADVMQRATLAPFTVPDVDWASLWNRTAVPAPPAALH